MSRGGEGLPWTSRRLGVRRLRESDLEALHGLLSDPEVMRYLEPPYTREQTGDFLKTAGLAEKSLIYGVEAGGEFVGYVIFHPYGTDGGVELGWVLRPDVWGKGYAGELTELLLEQATGKYSYAVIECVPEQEATRHIALKYGFRRIGTEDGLEIYWREIGPGK